MADTDNTGNTGNAGNLSEEFKTMADDVNEAYKGYRGGDRPAPPIVEDYPILAASDASDASDASENEAPPSTGKPRDLTPRAPNSLIGAPIFAESEMKHLTASPYPNLTESFYYVWGHRLGIKDQSVFPSEEFRRMPVAPDAAYLLFCSSGSIAVYEAAAAILAESVAAYEKRPDAVEKMRDPREAATRRAMRLSAGKHLALVAADLFCNTLHASFGFPAYISGAARQSIAILMGREDLGLLRPHLKTLGEDNYTGWKMNREAAKDFHKKHGRYAYRFEDYSEKASSMKSDQSALASRVASEKTRAKMADRMPRPGEPGERGEQEK